MFYAEDFRNNLVTSDVLKHVILSIKCQKVEVDNNCVYTKLLTMIVKDLFRIGRFGYIKMAI